MQQSKAESPATGNSDNTKKRPREIVFQSPTVAPPVASNGNPRPTSGAQLVTVADLAQRKGMKRDGNEWHGAHPTGNGATKDGFILNDDGTAWDRPTQTPYTSAQVAELFDIAPDDYQPVADYRASNGHASAPRKPSNTRPKPKAPKAEAKPAPDEAPEPAPIPKTPEERGITLETLKRFGIERVQGDKPNRNGWKYPTRHPNGARGRDRFKNARAKSKTEAKYQWWGDGQEPDVYNVTRIPEEAPHVWAVGGETDVWAMHQNGFHSVCTFGETQGAAPLVAAIKERRVRVLHIALDNDTAGKNGAAALVRECQKQGQNFTLRRFDGAKGFDVCDEFARCEFDPEKFRAAMNSLPEIEPDQPDATPEPATIATAPNPFVPTPIDEVLQRPRRLWLVQDIFSERGTGLITGRAGSFKSLNVLDMGLCVSLGLAWQGHEVKQGRVVYVVAEGADTTADRVKAWKIRHQITTAPDFYVIEIPAQIAEPDQRALFLQAIASLKPALVIFDTLAQCNAGRNENDSGEMSIFTNAMQEISTALNCFVLTVHHNNKADSIRGSTSIEANTDAHISFKPSAGRVVTVHCERIKNSDFEPFSLIGRFQEIGEQDEYDREVRSLVFEPTETPEKATTTTSKERECLELLPSHGATSEDWFALASAKGVIKGTFYRCRDSLRDKKEVILSTKTGLYHPKSHSLI
jgi:hypothetical protein